MPAKYHCDGPKCEASGPINRGNENGKPKGWTEFHQWKGEDCIGEWVLCPDCTKAIIGGFLTVSDIVKPPKSTPETK